MIEDDEMIGSFLKKILEKEGFQVHWAKSAEHGISVLKRADIGIIDVMLPGEDGFSLIRRMKEGGYNIPVIFLTALDGIDDKLAGLSAGDDYVCKPFDPRELAARMRNLLAQTYGTYTDIGGVFINAETSRVFAGKPSTEVKLTAIERKIFFYLYHNKNHILSKEQFLTYLWHLEDRNDNLLNVHIKKIRAKLGDQQGRLIENIYGEGYRLNTYSKQ
ncbi:response regulator [Bacillus lacus]|uniref:Response regulator n=2 Tax=Metabacillus lacus TaxID=1983721 RepID=A0A7X2J0M9_9BACI|nr:response regulator [Metabacillus lacus]